MDSLIVIGVAVLIDGLKDRGIVRKFVDAYAKIYVKIENVAKVNPVLQSAIELQRAKEAQK